MNTVIVGSAHNYNFAKIQHWWKSIHLSGFKGPIYVLSYENDASFENTMRKHEISVLSRKLQAKQVVVARFFDLAKLAETLPEDTWIISTDTSDLVFQYDPREFLAYVDKDVVIASEGVRFEDNRWTKKNLADSFPGYWELMRQRYFYNAGSFAARAGFLKVLAMEVFLMCKQNFKAKNHDQAALNILLQTKYEERVLFTRAMDQWCFCAASSLYAEPEDAKGYLELLPVIRGGKCYVNSGQDLTCMFHHYTRNEQMKMMVREMIDAEYAKAFPKS